MKNPDFTLHKHGNNVRIVGASEMAKRVITTLRGFDPRLGDNCDPNEIVTDGTTARGFASTWKNVPFKVSCDRDVQ